MEAFELLREPAPRARAARACRARAAGRSSESRLVEFALTLPRRRRRPRRTCWRSSTRRAPSRAAGGGGLRAFTRWLAESTEQRGAARSTPASPRRPTTSCGCMTMHGAKGLEFPIVVLGEPRRQRARTSARAGARRGRAAGCTSASAAAAGRSGHFATPGYDERWEDEKRGARRRADPAALRGGDPRARPPDRALHSRASGSRGRSCRRSSRSFPRTRGPRGRGRRRVDARRRISCRRRPRSRARAGARSPTARSSAALAEREAWIAEHEELTRSARAELPFVVASSVERARRPLAAEASHSGATLLVSEGPPLPVGDALHLVMERVSLPDAEDLEDVRCRGLRRGRDARARATRCSRWPAAASRVRR